MNRGRKIILVAHCLLNTNAKVLGISTVKGAAPIVPKLMEKGYGVIQLPCIEMVMFSSRRWGVVYEQCDFPEFRQTCVDLLTPIVNQIEDYIHNDYEISGVIGVDGSPTCAVNRTVSGKWGGELCGADTYQYSISTLIQSKGMGVMMEELKKMFDSRNLSINFYALDEEDMSSWKEIMSCF